MLISILFQAWVTCEKPSFERVSLSLETWTVSRPVRLMAVINCLRVFCRMILKEDNYSLRKFRIKHENRRFGESEKRAIVLKKMVLHSLDIWEFF